MPLYRPSELSAFLSTIGVSPKRELSQNFLIDGNIVQKIVAHVPNGTTVLEIGPGPGVLTEAFLEKDCRVVAVEKDKELAKALSRLDPSGKQLTIIEDDVLNCSLSLLVPSSSTLVSNIPYSVTTPILERLLFARKHFPRAIFMVQEEVAHRLCDTPSASLLGTLIALCYRTDLVFCVSKRCFWPVPAVDSAVISCEAHSPEWISDQEQEKIFSVIKESFLHRRKMLAHTLRSQFPKEVIATALTSIGLSEKSRPEDLSAMQWLSFLQRIGFCSSSKQF